MGQEIPNAETIVVVILCSSLTQERWFPIFSEQSSSGRECVKTRTLRLGWQKIPSKEEPARLALRAKLLKFEPGTSSLRITRVPVQGRDVPGAAA
jgi:hypothetical protein